MEQKEEMEGELKAVKEKVGEVNRDNDRFNSEFTEKLRSKTLYIETLTEDIKHLKSTVRS